MQANQQIPKVNRSYTLSGEPALFADRGFTGHEFLADFNLYNMNGRLYDPVVGRFLSPDPYISDPSYSQSYNRYSYVLNNPLKYNDPTGELPLWALWGIATAGNWLLGGMDNWLNKGMSFKQSFSTANNPIVFSGNYHPGSNSWSNSQVNAHRLVGAMANAEQGAHNYIAGFSGMGRNGEGPLFTTTPFDQFVGESPLAGGVADEQVGSVTLLFNAPNQDFSGFWGGVKYYWTGGNIGGYQYSMNGQASTYSPIMGTAPLPGIGKIGAYSQLVKMTRGYKGAIQAHHLIEVRHLKRLMMSTKNSPSVILSKSDHALMKKNLQQLLPYGQTYTKSQLISAYRQAYGKYPDWVKHVIEFLQ